MRTVILGDLAAPKRSAFAMGPFGSRITTTNFVDSGVPVIRGGNLNGQRLRETNYVFLTPDKANELSSAAAYPGDIVITHRGTLGQVVMVPRNSKFPKYIVSQSQLKLSLDESLAYPEYVTYWLQSPAGQNSLFAYTAQTGVPAIAQPLSSVRMLKLPLPPLAEQRGIAAMLGALDDKIESNRRLLSLIWEVATASIEKACEISSISVTVDKVATFHNRRRVPLSSRERDKRPGPYPYYGATGIVGYVDDFLFDEVLVLVGEDGSVVRDGGAPVLQYIWGKSWINNHAHPLTGKGISNELLLLALARADVRQLVTGAVQPKISMGNLKSYALELPTGDVLNKLESKLTSLFDMYRHRSDENLKLTKLRDALLPELLSGRIRVPEAKETVEGAV